MILWRPEELHYAVESRRIEIAEEMKLARLARQNRLLQTMYWDRLLAWIGGLLIALGKSLQGQYGLEASRQ